MIPHFPIRMGSTVNSTDSDEGSRTDATSKQDVKSNDDEKFIFESTEDPTKYRRYTTDWESYMQNSFSPRPDFYENNDDLSKVSGMVEHLFPNLAIKVIT